jgi:hypothetical protein
MATRATLSNVDVVGMIRTEASLSVQTAAMKVQWCLLNHRFCIQPFLITIFFLST